MCRWALDGLMTLLYPIPAARAAHEVQARPRQTIYPTDISERVRACVLRLHVSCPIAIYPV